MVREEHTTSVVCGARRGSAVRRAATAAVRDRNRDMVRVAGEYR